MNEALTEWIAIRFREELYQTSGDFHWNGVSYACPYPAWIIEAVVQKLDDKWQHLADTLPDLVQYRIFNATDLLYTIYFSDATMVSYFKEALVLVTGEQEAFEKLSMGCEQFFHFTHHHQPLNEEELKVSMREMYEMFGPFFEQQLFATFHSSEAGAASSDDA